MIEASDQEARGSASLRYSNMAVLLHWLIAGCVLAMLALGLFGASVETALGKSAIAVHKILGITILVLTIIALSWRVAHPAPALPTSMAAALRVFARSVHFAFYLLLLIMPLSGWWMTSAFPKRHPIDAILFDIPFLPVPVSMASATAAHEVHEIGAWLMIALAALHIGAALKHHFVDRDEISTRMSMQRAS